MHRQQRINVLLRTALHLALGPQGASELRPANPQGLESRARNEKPFYLNLKIKDGGHKASRACTLGPLRGCGRDIQTRMTERGPRPDRLTGTPCSPGKPAGGVPMLPAPVHRDRTSRERDQGSRGPTPEHCSPVRFLRSSLALKADTRPHCQPSRTTTCPHPVPGTEGRAAWTPSLAAAGTCACQAQGREPQTCPGTTGRTQDWPGPPRVDPVPPGRETGRGSLTPPPGRPSTGRLQTKPSPVSGAVTDPETARVHESLLCHSVTSGL